MATIISAGGAILASGGSVVSAPEIPSTPPGDAATTAQSSVDQYSSTFVYNFDQAEQVGEYWNGDPFVLSGGTVDITSITPASFDDGGRWKHGTMLDWFTTLAEGGGGTSPGPGIGVSKSQGFDSYEGSSQHMGYSSGLNVDPGNTGSNLTVTGEASIIKSKAKTTPDAAGRPKVSDLGILTIVTSRPLENSFRPSPHDADKSASKAAQYTTADVDLSRIPTLTAPASAPSYEDAMRGIRRPHMFGVLDYNYARSVMASNNYFGNYGANNGQGIANAALLMCTDAVTEEERNNIAFSQAQMGLDVYSRLKIGGVWYGAGALYSGYKLPLVLAATLLQDSDMIDMCNGTILNNAPFRNFAEDQQTFYVEASDVGDTNPYAANNPAYVTGDIGDPEWGEQHQKQSSRDTRLWNAPNQINAGGNTNSYRSTNFRVQIGAACAANLVTGARAIWNWEPYFDYADRACFGDFYYNGVGQPNGNPVANYPTGATGNEFDEFQVDMMQTYRSSYPPSGYPIWVRS